MIRQVPGMGIEIRSNLEIERIEWNGGSRILTSDKLANLRCFNNKKFQTV